MTHFGPKSGEPGSGRAQRNSLTFELLSDLVFEKIGFVHIKVNQYQLRKVV